MIELRNISLKLDGRELYGGLSLKIPAGGRLLVKGNSGSGKTTLLRMILGFVQPEMGTIWIDGQKLTVDNVWQMRQKMAYVSQEMQMGRGYVESFIKEVMFYKSNRTKPYDRYKVLDLLSTFYLDPNTIDKKLEDLSGGELQRLAIVVTLLLDRKIFLLDEVTSALDQRLKLLMVDYFLPLKDKTLIISSHDSVWHLRDLPTLNLVQHGRRS